jgi:hypothetical protein
LADSKAFRWAFQAGLLLCAASGGFALRSNSGATGRPSRERLLSVQDRSVQDLSVQDRSVQDRSRSRSGPALDFRKTALNSDAQGQVLWLRRQACWRAGVSATGEPEGDHS